MIYWLGKKSMVMTKWIGTPASLVVHTLIFAVAFILPFFGVFSIDEILLILTTLVSLEAIYLAIFIQMTINRQTKQIEDVGENIEGIQEEVEDLGEDVQEISKDVEDISEDIDKIQEEQRAEDGSDEEKTRATLDSIETSLQRIIGEIEGIKACSNNHTNNN